MGWLSVTYGHMKYFLGLAAVYIELSLMEEGLLQKSSQSPPPVILLLHLLQMITCISLILYMEASM